MKKWILLFWVLMMTAAGALADTAPVKMAVPPEAITTQAEGELEDYAPAQVQRIHPVVLPR